jgi:uracil-DNA glycosylase family 4
MKKMATPQPDCALCPRLQAFRHENRAAFTAYHNAPVPSFGAIDARLLVVGLAPGLHGANQSGRPFTGDYAGIILYEALARHGFAQGTYGARADDGFTLVDCRITNAVRCVPPANKPETVEIRTCNSFLREEIAAMPRLRVIVSLGQISHNAVLKAVGVKPSAAPFTHGGLTRLSDELQLLSSYHTSRYNINTGTLTVAMFDGIIQRAAALLHVI